MTKIQFKTPDRFITSEERARRVDAILKRKGKTRYWLNQEMGFKSRSVYNLFAPRSDGKLPDPRLSTLVRMATALGCSVGFLVDKKETRPRGTK